MNFNSGEIDSAFADANDVVLDLAYRSGTNELAIASADGSS